MKGNSSNWTSVLDVLSIKRMLPFANLKLRREESPFNPPSRQVEKSKMANHLTALFEGSETSAPAWSESMPFWSNEFCRIKKLHYVPFRLNMLAKYSHIVPTTNIHTRDLVGQKIWLLLIPLLWTSKVTQGTRWPVKVHLVILGDLTYTTVSCFTLLAPSNRVHL